MNTPEITPIHPEITTHLYDLYKVHSRSPLLDSETIPFIPIQWSGPPNQVPFTFPIRPTEKRPFFCFDFIKFGKCDKKDCIFPHLTIEQCEQSGIKIGHCYAFAETGKCENRNNLKKKKRRKSKNLQETDITNVQFLDDKNVVENLGTSSAPDFDSLLKEFNS
ncbi:3802_t:CDS:2 [Diversispora eburnea]|uniref:3802_t:CDS:1 n=1 Tax=Diversispora eburnea TaxID=1213867 RepID=A0A9N8VTX8_9GLOM|nr:3802_t:CDS:2 [Diversispora eburnea]